MFCAEPLGNQASIDLVTALQLEQECLAEEDRRRVGLSAR